MEAKLSATPCIPRRETEGALRTAVPLEPRAEFYYGSSDGSGEAFDPDEEGDDLSVDDNWRRRPLEYK